MQFSSNQDVDLVIMFMLPLCDVQQLCFTNRYWYHVIDQKRSIIKHQVKELMIDVKVWQEMTLPVNGDFLYYHQLVPINVKNNCMDNEAIDDVKIVFNNKCVISYELKLYCKKWIHVYNMNDQEMMLFLYRLYYQKMIHDTIYN